MPLIFVVSVKKQQPEPSACQLRDLQNALTILNTVSVDVTSFLVTAHLGVLNRTVPRISSLASLSLASLASPPFLYSQRRPRPSSVRFSGAPVFPPLAPVERCPCVVMPNSLLDSLQRFVSVGCWCPFCLEDTLVPPRRASTDRTPLKLLRHNLQGPLSAPAPSTPESNDSSYSFCSTLSSCWHFPESTPSSHRLLNSVLLFTSSCPALSRTQSSIPGPSLTLFALIT